MTTTTLNGVSDSEPFDADAATVQYRIRYRSVLSRIAALGTAPQTRTSDAMRGMLRFPR